MPAYDDQQQPVPLRHEPTDAPPGEVTLDEYGYPLIAVGREAGGGTGEASADAADRSSSTSATDIPVRVMGIVETLSHLPEVFSAGQLVVPAYPIMIAAALPRRARLVVTNLDTNNSVALMPSSACTFGAASYVLAKGATLEMRHKAAVWAVAAAGQSIALSWFSESWKDG